MRASNEWANRPPDQRFWNLEEMLTATRRHKECAREAPANSRSLTVAADGQDLRLRGTRSEASFGHYAFGQFAKLSEAPAEYLRSIPADLAARCLNHGLRNAEPRDFQLLVDSSNPQALRLRAVTSQRYTRLWNADLVARVIPFAKDGGWVNPPARAMDGDDRARKATKADILACSINLSEGMLIGPAGLYASDKDMFMFLVDPRHPIHQPGASAPLYRGFIMDNSEVGDRSWSLSTFLFNGCCSNHIIWGMSESETIRLRHVGTNDERAFRDLEMEVERYSESSGTELEARIRKARATIIGKSRDEVITKLFEKRLLSRHEGAAAMDAAEKYPKDHGNAALTSAWAVSAGVTRISQEAVHTDVRVRLDRTAGKVLEMVF
jgi:hypothetical protein